MEGTWRSTRSDELLQAWVLQCNIIAAEHKVNLWDPPDQQRGSAKKSSMVLLRMKSGDKADDRCIFRQV
jgi:hypothetical protein